jgi:7-cyano-7-deazaguanine synthase
MDSTTLGYYLSKEQNFHLSPVYVMYGSNHMKNEVVAVRKIIEKMKENGIGTDEVIFLPLTLKDIYGAANSKKEIPLIQDPGLIPDAEDKAQRTTVVPFRNLLMLTILAGIGEMKDIYHLAHGAVKDDYTSYKDCRDDFFSSAEETINLGCTEEGSPFKIHHPFTQKSKIDVVKWGVANDVPYKLTSTCYKGQALACGKCDACKERLDAFRAAGAKDPIKYFNF